MAEEFTNFLDEAEASKKPKSIKRVFERLLIAKENEHTKAKTAFCRACAIVIHTDKLKQLKATFQRQVGYEPTDEQIAEIKQFKDATENFDFSPYEQEDYFDLIADTEVMEGRLVGNEKIDVVAGHNVDYRCKRYRHGVTLAMNLDEYNRWKERTRK